MYYKKKYDLLNKEEKIKLKNKYYKTKEGQIAKNRLDRLFLYGVIGIIISTYLYITESSLSYIIVASILLVISIVYFIASFVIRKKELNNFLIK